MKQRPPNPGDISGFRLNEKSRPVLKGDVPIRLRKDPGRSPPGKRAKKPRPRPGLSDDDPGRRLFEKLRAVRREVSESLGLPPYCVFHDKTLVEMAALKPATRDELLSVTGVGEKKLEQFGEIFLDAIRDGFPD
jgi:ATP-dependent DNA helicase RecQ